MKRLLLLETALSTLGEREVPGAASNPTILGWIRTRLPWARDDSTTPWCGLWLAAMCQTAGLPVPYQAGRAASWVGWGQVRAPVDAKPGDVAVLARKGGKHVAIVLRVDRRFVWLLGGNQGDAVSVRAYPYSRVECIRTLN